MADLKFEIQFASAKPGSVLNGFNFEKGMIIAVIKRAIVGVQNALNLTTDDELSKVIPEILQTQT